MTVKVDEALLNNKVNCAELSAESRESISESVTRYSGGRGNTQNFLSTSLICTINGKMVRTPQT